MPGLNCKLNESYAKICRENGRTCDLELFHDPENIEVRENVPRASLKPINDTVLTHQRVYWKNGEEFFYRTGRYIQPLPNGQVRVRLQGDGIDKNVGDIYLSSDQCKWQTQNFLGHFITDSRNKCRLLSAFFDAYFIRKKFVRGMDAYLSSSIYLEKYQFNVIRTVLSDPVQRYLLADEVGLGKTIEAGVIIKQFLMDYGDDAVVLLIVPKSLKRQWEMELKGKLGIWDKVSLDGNPPGILLCSDTDAEIIKKGLDKAHMLVIDEAHIFSSYAFSPDQSQRDLFQVVKERFASPDKKLLLLSATPALHNEQSYLAMLTLLDSVTYRLEDIDAFRDRVKHREVIRGLCIELNAHVDDLFLPDYLQTLKETLPDDTELIIKVDRLREVLDAGQLNAGYAERNSLLTELRELLNNRYRLHRRVLRNRRELVHGVSKGRGGLRIVCDDQHQVRTAMADVVEYLMRWRSLIQGSQVYDVTPFAKIFLIFFDSLQMDPLRLRDAIKLRLGHKVDGNFSHIERELLSTAHFVEGEEELLTRMSRELPRYLKELWEQKIAFLDEVISSLLQEDPERKFIIYSSSVVMADDVAAELSKQYDLERMIPDYDLLTGEDPDWIRFLHNHACNILVCDKSGEEGMNLQNLNAVIIHLDLPFAPNRIEQRIGRVDRFGNVDAVLSVYLLQEHDGIYRSWVKLLDELFCVFRRSVSSLQYLIEEEMKNFPLELFQHGVEIDEALQNRLGGENGIITQRFKFIDYDDIDYSLTTDDDSNTLFKRILESDEMVEIYGDPLYRVVQNYINPGFGLKIGELPSGFSIGSVLNAQQPRLSSYIDIGSTAGPGFTEMRKSACMHPYALIRNGNRVLEKLMQSSLITDDNRNFLITRTANHAENYTKLYFYAKIIISHPFWWDRAFSSDNQLLFKRLIEEIYPPDVVNRYQERFEDTHGFNTEYWFDKNGNMVTDTQLVKWLRSDQKGDQDVSPGRRNQIEVLQDVVVWQNTVSHAYEAFLNRLRNDVTGNGNQQFFAKLQTDIEKKLINVGALKDINLEAFYMKLLENSSKVMLSVINSGAIIIEDADVA